MCSSPWLLAIACLIACAPLAVADEPSAQKQQEERIAVQAWAGSHPDCAEWTDGCTVCARLPAAIACSTPGIACLAQPVVCRRPMQATTPVPAPATTQPPASAPESKP